MALLDSVLTLFVALFAAWTAAVHLCMSFGWPAWSVPLPLLAVMTGLHLLLRPQWRLAWRRSVDAGDLPWLGGLLALGAGFAALSLVLDVPTADDFNFFHRALAQLGALGEPFFLRDTAFNEDGLAPISPLHVLTSWELGVALAAHTVGLDPLGAYHNATVVVLNGLLVTTYASLLREFGFARWAAFAGTAAVMSFFLLDDPSLRSFGLAYRTLWVGKSVQWALVFPLLLLFCLRYGREPTLGGWVRVACACSAAIGLSGTGVFLAPGLVGCAAVAAWIAFAPDGRRSRVDELVAFAVLPLAAFHPVAIGLLLVFGVLQQPQDLSAWVSGFPAQWSENLLIAFGNGWGVLRAVVLAGGVPALILAGRDRRFLLALVGVLILFFANPFSGELWLRLVQPGSYWRVMFLFPIPLGVGLAAAALVERMRFAEAEGDDVSAGGAEKARVAGALLVALASLGMAYLQVAPEARRMPLPFRTKAPGEWRLPRNEARFAREVASDLRGRSLLAGPPFSWVASLVVPGVRLEAARHKDTLHVFANVGRPEEGRRRIAAWEWARRCESFPVGAAAAAESLRRGVDALVFPSCPPGAAGDQERRALLESAPGHWVEVHRAHGYRLWVRADGSG